MSASLHEIAVKLAPCLRDKFDFSTDAQFKDWVELSYKAAQAFLDKNPPAIKVVSITPPETKP